MAGLATSAVRGIDVSAYQPENYPTAGYGFVFVKSTESNSYVNPRAVAQIARGRAAGMVIGHYLFGRHAVPMKEQVDYFRAHTDVRPGDLIAFDWEGTQSSPIPTEAERDEALRLLKAAYPNNRVGLYTYVYAWKRLDTKSNAGDFLWIADPNHEAGSPGILHPWLFHQYGDLGGTLDQNVCSKTLAELRAWATVHPSTTPPKPQRTPEPKVRPVPQPIGTPYRKPGKSWAAGYHTGVDFECPDGTVVRAAYPGKVIGTGNVWGAAYGAHQVVVESKLPDGRVVQHLYAHMMLNAVPKGATVAAGHPIGKSGHLGKVTGPHLHFEVRVAPFTYGHDIDPAVLLP